MTEPIEPADLAARTQVPEPDADGVVTYTPEAAPDESSLDDHTRAVLKKARSEARNLRERLHEAEQRANAAEEKYGEAAAVVSQYQLNEVKRLASEVLHDPDDLLRHDPDMSAYFDTEFEGIINADNVVAAAKKLAAERPHLAKPIEPPPKPPTDRPIESLRPGASPGEKPASVSWSTVLHGR
jgi:hypothetical protein